MNGAVGFFLQPRFAFCKNGLEKAGNHFSFVKIILLKTDNCALTLRKRLFCDAKPTLLPCKTAAFGTQNNRNSYTTVTLAKNIYTSSVGFLLL